MSSLDAFIPSETPRTGSSHRPRTTASRPETAASDRPDTSGSIISTLEPAPHTFRPDLEEFDEEEDDEDSDESEADGVFAFSRPQTGQVPSLSANNNPFNFPFNPPPVLPPPPPSAESESPFTHRLPPSSSPNTAPHFDVPLPSTGFNPTYTANPIALPEPSLRYPPRSILQRSNTAASKASKDSDEASPFDNDRHAVRMTSFAPLVANRVHPDDSKVWFDDSMEDLASDAVSYRGRSRGGTHMTSELGGPTTIPDGMTTRGGGEQSQEDFEKGEIMADMDEDDSPYAEVRASVSNMDDPDLPVMTIRVWTIGLFLALCLASIDTFFYFRNPAPGISPTLVILIAYPLGKSMAWVMPITDVSLPERLPYIGGWTFSLNPGIFNIKEHALIAIMVCAAAIQPYALQASIASTKYYGVHFTVGFEICLLLATQLTALSYSGVARRLLTWPASAIWPLVLIDTTILNMLHADEDRTDGRISRTKFFGLVSIGAFLYAFIPGYLFAALGYFSWICWIRPNDIVVNQIFGAFSGLGGSLLSFDWSQISWIGSPLITPWWAQVNIIVGVVLCYWIIVPAMYYTNVWNFKYMPILSSGAYDRFGGAYNYTAVVGSDYMFNTTAYLEYSPLYISASFMMTYMLIIALATCAIVHTMLHHGPKIIKALKGDDVEEDDIHAKLMRAYPEVPMWWYGVSFVLFFVIGIVAVAAFKTDFPVWALIISLLISAVYFLPAGYVFAATGQQSSMTNVIGQIIPGYVLPGQPIANMLSKAFTVETIFMCGQYSLCLKLGHYMKIPPRVTFTAIVAVVVLTSLVQVGMKFLLFKYVENICNETNSSHLTCPQVNVFFTASVLWGLIGPRRQFGAITSLYHPAFFSFLVGAILPVPFWYYSRKYPTSWARHVDFVVMLNGPTNIPPATPINYTSFTIVGFIFQYWLRRRQYKWWSRYNYVLAAALDVGTIIGIIVIFLCLQLPKDGSLQLNWIGNTIFDNTLDYMAAPFYEAPEGGFGPDTWPI